MSGQQKFFHEYNPGFYTTRLSQPTDVLFGFGTERKSLCPCGEEFLRFAKTHFPDTMLDPKPQELEQALLTLVREYAYRRQFLKAPHRMHSCLPEVFDELVMLLNSKLEELYRLPPQGVAAAPLLMGEESEEPLLPPDEDIDAL